MHYLLQDSGFQDFVEVDPSGRYGRYDEILGKGASKTVYRAFDEYEGIEVAWNQVKLNDFLQSPEDLERLYCEIHLLKTLKHKNIMKFYSSWVDISKRKINFVTEMFTSGTLRQYRQKHRRVNIRAVKHWCRQILSGLLYLHSHDPPIIHRDLKCDNIFVNGNQGEVKIGDLGLAAILRKPHADHCVGTPEFMAPEVYEEAYNELVDIYSFGMCVLEMVTFEYPYSECSHPAEIYKKVISGRRPEALYKVKDPEVRQFVEKCLAPISDRLSARELLNDPFLQIDEHSHAFWDGEITAMGQIVRHPSNYTPLKSNDSFITCKSMSEDLSCHTSLESGWECDALESKIQVFNILQAPEDDLCSNLHITIKGTRGDDGCIFLRLRISDREGQVRNIYFPFDVENDTALGVAAEMVAELNITDHEVTQIAEMIDGEVSSLVPEWKPGLYIEDMPGPLLSNFSVNNESDASSVKSLLDYLSTVNHNGLFEEVAHQLDGSKYDRSILSSSHANSRYFSYSDEETNHITLPTKDDREDYTTRQCKDLEQQSHPKESSLKKWEMESSKPAREGSKDMDVSTCAETIDFREFNFIDGIPSSSALKPSQESSLKPLMSFHLGTNFSYHIPTEGFLEGDSDKNSSSFQWSSAERSLCSGIHNSNNVLNAKAFPIDALHVRSS
ncbi:hypothetical protein HPP92_023570 [Vanilla planifolia]|uniref:non-specific serine/threonine protein kinase n=1 Tax=Vanilla planifolia TaxID=51239 RepID=A0A835PT25_VANPL|nr:hypothetical protein HPP92_023570 [Vanilla planifolia]